MFDGWRADSCADQSIGVESSGTSPRLNSITAPLLSDDVRDVGVKSITIVPLGPWRQYAGGPGRVDAEEIERRAGNESWHPAARAKRWSAVRTNSGAGISVPPVLL